MEAKTFMFERLQTHGSFCGNAHTTVFAAHKVEHFIHFKNILIIKNICRITIHIFKDNYPYGNKIIIKHKILLS